MQAVDPTSADFDRLITFLPILYADGFRPIRYWGGGNKTEDGVIVMPWPEYEEAVDQFFYAASDECWKAYNYTSINIREIACDPQRVACATLDQIKAILTWCVRGERFCDGLWGDVIDNGLIRNVLLRLQELKPQ